MPTYRKRNYKRSRKPKPMTRYQNYAAAGNQLYQDIKGLRKLIGNVEYKSYSVTNTDTDVSDTATAVVLNGVPIGDTYVTRDGNSIRMVSLQCDGNIKMKASGIDTNVRIIWVCDLQPSAGQPTFNNVINNATGDPTIGLRELLNRNRFIILKDRKLRLSTQNPVIDFSFYKKIDMHTLWNGDYTGYATFRKNALICFVISDTPNATAATTGPTLNMYNRVRYLDN